MFNLAGADTEGQSAERSVRGGMAVTADHCRARKGKALLRPDYVYNTLSLVPETEVCQTKLLDVVFESDAL